VGPPVEAIEALFHLTRSVKYSGRLDVGRLAAGPMVKEVLRRLRAGVQRAHREGTAAAAAAASAAAGGAAGVAAAVRAARVAAQQRAGDGDYGGQPLVLFSAHDSTIQSILAALGAPASTTPPYASALAFELRRAPGGGAVSGEEYGYVVRVALNGVPLAVTGDGPWTVAPPALRSDGGSSTADHLACGRVLDGCPLPSFARAVAAVVPASHDAWRAECDATGGLLGGAALRFEGGSARLVVVLVVAQAAALVACWAMRVREGRRRTWSGGGGYAGVPAQELQQAASSPFFDGILGSLANRRHQEDTSKVR